MAADKTQPLELPRLPPRRAELKPAARVAMIAVVAEIRRVEMPAAYRQRTTSMSFLASVTLCSPPSSRSRISTRWRGRMSVKIAR